eukprot:710478-Pelagomonas_calceolata.AAC.3
MWGVLHCLHRSSFLSSPASHCSNPAAAVAGSAASAPPQAAAAGCAPWLPIPAAQDSAQSPLDA